MSIVTPRRIGKDKYRFFASLRITSRNALQLEVKRCHLERSLACRQAEASEESMYFAWFANRSTRPQTICFRRCVRVLIRTGEFCKAELCN